MKKLLDELLKRHLATLEKVCNAVGDIVDIIRFGDDLGMSSGPFMDDETYRTLFKPRHKILCDYVKEHSQMHTFIDSCGSISLLMPDMIEAGIEVFNPVQTNAYQMEPEFLKKIWKRLYFLVRGNRNRWCDMKAESILSFSSIMVSALFALFSCSLQEPSARLVNGGEVRYPGCRLTVKIA